VITYHKTLTVTIDCSVVNAEKIIDALGMIRGVLNVDPYLAKHEKVWKVYKLVSKKDPNTVYIGSSRSKLSQRLAGHMNEMQLSPERDKNKWLKDNMGYVEILPIAIADSEDDILRLEEMQMIKYVKLGYNVLNRQYPASFKRYSGKNSKWKNMPGQNPELRLRMFECIEHWIKAKDSLPTLGDIWQEIGEVPGKDFQNAHASLHLAGLLESVYIDKQIHQSISAKAFLLPED
jgi:hypothetical protein